MNSLTMVVYWLVIIGGLNWGLVGLGAFAGGNWNVVNLVLGSWPQVEWLVYVLVGLSAAWMLVKKMGMNSSSDSM
ncbi:DUF378 domain-containing protein [Patescibacteria group bacterium]|nr:DUF378 domain-containing protein [Patescibacteria group bacterium]